ncbi:hypothetical protein F2Q68_00006675 [Brassica cretica]|uniref:Uncharacterized protein n=1 Tax=Brassica cretica TaxID=69181 RepID=A0A8S9J7N8_BRACR|nr:hypothetical protein F2Q68_00006675 [Brassica cretica]
MCSEQKNFKEPTVIESTGIDILVSVGGCVSVVWLLFVLPTLTPTPTLPQPHIVVRF